MIKMMMTMIMVVLVCGRNMVNSIMIYSVRQIMILTVIMM